MRLKRATPLILILAALSLAACGSDDSGSDSTAGGATAEEAETTAPAEAETAPSGEAVRSAEVEIVDFAYSPQTVTVAAGGKVTWRNEDADDHTVTLDDGSFESGDLAEGKLKSESFKSPGTFAYHCEIHPEMTGTVEVVEPQ